MNKVLSSLIKKGYLIAYITKYPESSIEEKRWDLSGNTSLSLCNLGCAYEYGISREKIREQAYKSYEKAAWQGDFVGQFLYRKIFYSKV